MGLFTHTCHYYTLVLSRRDRTHDLLCVPSTPDLWSETEGPVRERKGFGCKSWSEGTLDEFCDRVALTTYRYLWDPRFPLGVVILTGRGVSGSSKVLTGPGTNVQRRRFSGVLSKCLPRQEHFGV